MTAEISKTERVLFPERELTLLDGTIVEVKPWSIALGRKLLPKCAEVFGEVQQSAAADQELNAETLIDTAMESCIEIVAETIGWEVAQVEALTLEEVIDLIQAVLDVCVIREDGGGVLGKLLGLVGKAGGIQTQVVQAMTNRSTPKSTGPKAQKRHRP